MPLPIVSTGKWLAKNELVIPKVAMPVSPIYDATKQYMLTMGEFEHRFHPDMSPVRVFGYNGTYPGPTIVAKTNEAVRINWFNGLEGKSLDSLISFGVRQGMEEDHMLEKPHHVVHVHGARVPATSDGFPHHFSHPNEGHLYYYPNKQAASTLWYHDHAMDVTRLNVYAGLCGMYLLRGDGEAFLPSGKQEIPLVLQDKSFTEDGSQLYYEQEYDKEKAKNDPNYTATPEFVGQFPVVNGQIWPRASVAPRVYRLRILNGANTRIFNLSFCEEGDPGKKINFHVIGTEGGFLKESVAAKTLLMAPGERFDVLLDLRKHNNKNIILHNSHPDILDHRKENFAQLLQFAVKGKALASDEKHFLSWPIKLPARKEPVLPPGAPPNEIDTMDFAAIEAAADQVPMLSLKSGFTVQTHSFVFRRFVLEEYMLPVNTKPGLLTPTVLVNGGNWGNTPPIEIKSLGYEVWEFLNTTKDVHPMHVHLVQFMPLSRTGIEFVPATGDPVDPPMPKAIGFKYLNRSKIPPHENGWKDTIQCKPNEATRIIMRFDGYRGNYIYHCHILEHEDMGMMFNIKID
ncbi:MAG: multicopper oxidase domain-containing protein [Alphaproteobacteria bacterium]|nr:multicopper oxidase domain-containing protein [Alphaproteobacteria bacterium]